jgi:RNA polymerase sigma factor (sigma-70 family)
VGSLGDVDTADLVTRVRAGDQQAWAALTDRYTGLLWSVARSMRLTTPDAADAIQTTWLRLVESIDGIREPERLGSWLATTMRRECLVVLRRSARIRLSLSHGWDELPAATEELDEVMIREEQDAALWRAFDTLTPRCRALLRVLLADPPPQYAEVSAALDMPVGSIGPTRQRCLDSLRKILLTETKASARGLRARYEEGRHE